MQQLMVVIDVPAAPLDWGPENLPGSSKRAPALTSVLTLLPKWFPEVLYSSKQQR